MKKPRLTKLMGILLIASFALFSNKAQSQYTGAGLLVDVGDGGSLVGPNIKHFFSNNHALEGSVLFGSGLTMVQAMYGFHADLGGARGLKWYVGAGPGIAFGKGGGTAFSLAPMIGLDYKIGQVPLALSADWRPRFFMADGESAFNAARFALGLRFTF